MKSEEGPIAPFTLNDTCLHAAYPVDLLWFCFSRRLLGLDLPYLRACRNRFPHHHPFRHDADSPERRTSLLAMPALGIVALGEIARTERVPTEASATGSTTRHMVFTSEMDHLNPNVPILFASQNL